VLPDGVRGAGEIEITVTTDANNNVREVNGAGNAEANNSSVIVRASAVVDYADLAVATVTAPANARGGESIEIGWTVANQGTVAANAGGWSDRVILSRDNIIGNADDIVLATVRVDGPLGPGEDYSRSIQVLVPEQLDGAFFLTVVTDALGEVLEPDTRADNTFLPARTIQLAAPYADLQVEVAVGPESATEGGAATIVWRVRNLGDAPTNVSQWTDAVYLSSDTVLDGADILLGQFQRDGAIAPGETYTVSSNLSLPFGLTGDWYFLVRTTPVRRCSREPSRTTT
jgi:hypothetical protein